MKVSNKNNVKKDILQKILIFLLSLYFAFVVSYNPYTSFPFVMFFLILIIVFVILNFLFPKLSNFLPKKNEDTFLKREFIWYGLIILLVFIISFFIFYPAVTIPDSLSQWNQAKNDNYSNWHPVVETIIFFKIPYLIYDGLEACSIFQMIFIGTILLYFCWFLRKNFLSKKLTFLVLLLVVLNPSFMQMSMSLLKDVPFSWCLFLGTIFIIEIVLSKGKWIDSNLHKVVFIITLLGIMLFRHNGVVCIILLLLCLIFIYRDKFKFYLIVLLSLVIFRVILYGPVYNALNIDPDGGKAEMIGVPCLQIAYMYHNGLITSSDEKLLTQLAPKDFWEKTYNPANFNSLKWDRANYWEWVDDNFDKIMHLWFKSAYKHPKEFVVSYLNATSSIWKIADHIEFSESYSKYTSGTLFMKNFKEGYNSICEYLNESIFKYIFFNIGEGLLVIVFSLILVINKVKSKFEYYLPFVLVLSNTLVIMCLMTGEEVRFVYSQIICAFPLLIYALYLPKSKKKMANKKEGKLYMLYKKIFVDSTENALLQFIRYGFVGGVAAIVNIGMLYILTSVFHVYYIVSNIISFILGLIVNYILSKKLVFTKEVEISKYKEFTIYAIIGVVGLIFDTILLWLFTDKLSLFYLLSKILSTFIVFIWNFGARKMLYKIIK